MRTTKNLAVPRVTYGPGMGALDAAMVRRLPARTTPA